MKRRIFLARMVMLGAAADGIALFGGCALLPRATPVKVARVGVLGRGPDQPRQRIFDARMRELGWVEGTNLVMEYRDTFGQDELLPGLAAELVRLPVDVIVAGSSTTAVAAKRATGTIPIVMTSSQNPVETGLVATLARPGGNVTGLTSTAGDAALVAKKLQLLRDVVPGLSRVAVFANMGAPGDAPQLAALAPAASTLGLELKILDLQTFDELPTGFEAANSWGAEALLLVQTPQYLNALLVPMVQLPVQHHLPAMYFAREQVLAGALMSYGSNLDDLNRRAALFVDKILRGANPADLPVEQPTVFEFVVNVKTAAALALTIPPTVAAQVTEWIE